MRRKGRTNPRPQLPSPAARVWEPYDPAWLVALATVQAPHLVPALRECTRYSKESDAYLHFVDPTAPNLAESDWQFEINEFLESPSEGELVLDILKDGRVGGIEFLSRL